MPGVCERECFSSGLAILNKFENSKIAKCIEGEMHKKASSGLTRENVD